MCRLKAFHLIPALFTSLILFTVGLLALVIVPGASASPADPEAPAAPQVGPALSIPTNIPATANSVVTVPVSFAANGNQISSVIFSIDYDQTWLWFDSTVPMSITMSLPAGFTGGCTPNTSDTFAELNCFVFYFGPSPAPLSDGVLASIKLRTKAPTVNLSAKAGFSTTNPASFGSTTGQSVVGSTLDGSVYIDVGCAGCQPQLSIAQNIPASPNSIVSVPVNFTPNSSAISDLTFSIDYDQTWLWFDSSVPSAILPSLPAGFSGNCTANTANTTAELDCTVSYTGMLPKQALPGGVIFTLKLRTKSPGSTTSAAAGFSTTKPPVFFNTGGTSVPGTTQNGSVLITVAPAGDKKIYLPLVMHQPGGTPGCQNYALQNSQFNPGMGYWYFPPTVNTAGYSNWRSFSPSYSARTGIDPDYMPGFNLFSYSSVRTPVFTIPYNAATARIKFWNLPISTGFGFAPEGPLPALPETGKPLELSPADSDVQYVLVLDPWDNVLDIKEWKLVDSPYWMLADVNLQNFIGQTIKLQMGTFNNGWGGVAAMYIDDANLEICTP